MKTIISILALGLPCVAPAAADDILRLDGRIKTRGATLPLTGGFEIRFGMEQLSTEAGPDCTRLRAGGVTLIRRIADSPFGVGLGVRFLSGRIEGADFGAPSSNFALTAPFAGLSIRKTQFGSFTVDGLAGVAITRLNDADRFDRHASDDAARPVAMMSLRARF